MRILDISMPITEGMNTYKDKAEKRPTIRVVSDFTTGSAYETKVEMNLHTGTHIDMPLHMMEGGATIETLDLHRMISKCQVLDLTDVDEKVTREHLEGKTTPQGHFILLKTRNSLVQNPGPQFVYLDSSGAEYLAAQGVQGVGIDALGIERDQPGHPTHKALLGADIVILEGAVLGHVEEGEYTLVALPLSIPSAEASPVRAVLITG